MIWLCTSEYAHEYRARIDKVTAGLGCPACCSRKLIPGENDLGTVEPVLSLELHSYLNGKKAHELFPSDHKLWWNCLKEKHRHQQTTQNRRASKGCPKYKPAERILASTLEIAMWRTTTGRSRPVQNALQRDGIGEFYRNPSRTTGSRRWQGQTTRDGLVADPFIEPGRVHGSTWAPATST